MIRLGLCITEEAGWWIEGRMVSGDILETDMPLDVTTTLSSC